MPALFEALSGMKMSDLMGNIKGMAARKDDDGDGKTIDGTKS